MYRYSRSQVTLTGLAAYTMCRYREEPPQVRGETPRVSWRRLLWPGPPPHPVCCHKISVEFPSRRRRIVAAVCVRRWVECSLKRHSDLWSSVSKLAGGVCSMRITLSDVDPVSQSAGTESSAKLKLTANGHSCSKRIWDHLWGSCVFHWCMHKVVHPRPSRRLRVRLTPLATNGAAVQGDGDQHRRHLCDQAV